ncbi:hypothetical protein TNCV_2558681 [Trichonephila clavipes]|nr:hypothetical protein TNCV_2558681 [Trichonephila clavipes]
MRLRVWERRKKDQPYSKITQFILSINNNTNPIDQKFCSLVDRARMRKKQEQMENNCSRNEHVPHCSGRGFFQRPLLENLLMKITSLLMPSCTEQCRIWDSGYRRSTGPHDTEGSKFKVQIMRAPRRLLQAPNG